MKLASKLLFLPGLSVLFGNCSNIKTQPSPVDEKIKVEIQHPNVDLHLLKKGGLIIVFRHLSRDDLTLMPIPLEVLDLDQRCVNGSELSELGKAESVRLGNKIRSMRLPIQEIMFSPVCRNTQQVKLMKLGVKATPVRFLTYAGVWSEAEKLTIPDEFRKHLAVLTKPGQNLIYIGHKDTFRPKELDGFDPGLKMGDAAIFRPLGNGHYAFLGVILKKTWLE